ncbi:MAG: hypothetical protein AB7O24_05665 [Kofleriaceae bacterium]
MPSLSRHSLATLLAVGVLIIGCKKESANPAGDLQPKPVAVDTSKLSAPLLAHVPADSPYVIATFETVPVALYEKFVAAMEPVIKNGVSSIAAIAPEHKPLFDALVAELNGKLNAKGLESLGLSATPKLVVYGLGVLPVFRVDVKDHKTVLATIDRVAKQAGVTVPPQQQRGNVSYWRIDGPNQGVAIFALTDNQAIAAISTKDQIESSLDLILGIEKPGASMADGKMLKDAMTKHGLGGHMVGVIDASKLIGHALQLAGAKAPATCGPELQRLATRVPRVVFGTTEMTNQRMASVMVVELANDVAGELKGIKTALPGFTDVMTSNPMMAISVALDIANSQKLVGTFGSALGRLGAACENEDFSRGGDKLETASRFPLPEQITKLSGAMIQLKSLSMKGGRPDKLDAIAFASTSGAKALYELALRAQPEVAMLGIQSDGKLHDINKAALPMPVSAYAGVSDNAIVVGAGDTKPLAETMLSAKGGAKVPLLAMTFDYGAVAKLQAQLQAEAASDSDQAMMRLISLFGRANMTIDATDAGLVLTTMFDLK